MTTLREIPIEPNQTQTPVQKYADLSLKMIALATGAILFFPSTSDSFVPPYILNGCLSWFLITVFVGLVLNCVAFYIAYYLSEEPIKTSGLGNILIVCGLLLLSIYVWANIRNDQISKPRIVNITADSNNPSPGQWVKLSAEAVDQDADDLQWAWVAHYSCDGGKRAKEHLGDKRTIDWQLPIETCVKLYEIVVSVKDDHDLSITDTLTITLKDKPMNPVYEYIDHRIRLKIVELQRSRNLTYAKTLTEAFDTLTSMAVENIKSLEAIRDKPQTIDDALDEYLLHAQKQSGRIKDWRPCCKKFIGIWPFCNPKC